MESQVSNKLTTLNKVIFNVFGFSLGFCFSHIFKFYFIQILILKNFGFGEELLKDLEHGLSRDQILVTLIFLLTISQMVELKNNLHIYKNSLIYGVIFFIFSLIISAI